MSHIPARTSKPGDSVVQMKGIVKTFPGVTANDHIDLELKAGETRALLGENGAGKTTLMNLLYGLYRPDVGTIAIRGKEVVLDSPLDAITEGIGMVHQHFMLIPVLTVLQNVIIGLPGKMIINEAKIAQEILGLSEKYGLKVDPLAKISQLSVGEQQRVEIIKALYRGADVLILDEPTSVLTPKETYDMFQTLRRLAAEGHTIIFITHKLDEAMSVCEQVTVLRAGKVVSTVETAKITKKELARMMVGREVVFRIEKSAAKPGNPILEVRDLSALNDKGSVALKHITFVLNSGEILGVAGVAGNGQKELAEVITGLRKATGGKVVINQRDFTNRPPAEINKQALSYICEDRIGMGIVPEFSVAENMVLKTFNTTKFSKRSVMDFSAMRRNAEGLVSTYDVKTPDVDTPAISLSGGNIQRLILARELSTEPRIIIAANPTLGLDVGATESIRLKLVEERSKGAAILMISEDLEEIMSLSDRIAVMYEGTMRIVPADGTNVEEIGLMMTTAAR